MSSKESKASGFQAKDGLWYSTYQQMADANKKTNDEYLRSKGLIDAAASLKKKARQTKSASTSMPRAVTPTPTRRSKRVRRA
eukprot:CAMPEP_0117060870 /NCGR_PEP_ID=MMETSP0472-20121206/42341_1 /TAXON_ID=693140 ORGANISM="Tiarina fusus, Strain LIS" /NCGR_SAMPLE_ID=MMETSP0472 /ASSEMBLY_ACC=CAM_ASM_000603 /LENGTH=81 /DNA_ID=CAMNT_0004779253 /DNA_START=115 /DNA_END=357 /DNA_ORIENTATION=+